jgi:gamma-tubulin complex component 2
MLKDYQTLLSQLEHSFNTSPQFSLQKLWFYVHPTIHTLSLIYQLILELSTADDPGASVSDESSDEAVDPEQEARNDALGLGGAKLKAVLSEIDKNGASGIAVKGGEVLAIIYERMQNMSGDLTAHKVYGTLLKDAGKPYVGMLKTWVETGRLVDPYDELCVKESKFINRGILEMDYTDEYWERRYTVSHPSCFSFPCLDWYSSYATVRRYQVLRNAIKLGCPCQELCVDDYLVARVFRLSWRVGKTKYCWLGSI